MRYVAHAFQRAGPGGLPASGVELALQGAAGRVVSSWEGRGRVGSIGRAVTPIVLPIRRLRLRFGRSDGLPTALLPLLWANHQGPAGAWDRQAGHERAGRLRR